MVLIEVHRVLSDKMKAVSGDHVPLREGMESLWEGEGRNS